MCQGSHSLIYVLIFKIHLNLYYFQCESSVRDLHFVYECVKFLEIIYLRGHKSQLELIAKYNLMMQVLEQNQKEEITINRQNMHLFII